MLTFKIEIMSGDDGTVIKLIGRLRADYLPELTARLKTSGRRIVLEMNEVTLVDVESVRFLSTCETQGVELRRCPAYIREWIARERGRAS
jgi:anti-anti-sigma regulatory factor